MDELLIHNAEEKLKSGIKSKQTTDVATLIQEHVITALVGFCRQQTEIAKAIINSDKTIYDCCAEITKDTKQDQYISDFEAYSRAVRFYMPEMEIKCSTTVQPKGRPESALKLSLFDLME